MKNLCLLCLIMLATAALPVYATVKVEQCPSGAFTIYATVLPTAAVPLVFSNNATGDANMANLHCALLSKALATWYVKITNDEGATWTWAPLASLTAPASTPVAPMTATLSWVAPTTDTTGAPLTVPLTYNVYRGATTTALIFLKNVSGLTTTDVVTLPGVYWYAVTALNGTAESVKSAAVSAQISAGTVVSPAPPTAVTVH